jgi:hypothetical protein
MQESGGISTVGEAHDLGWKLRAYCRQGRRDGMKSGPLCTWSIDIDVPTLTMTHGRACPLSYLAGRLKCVRCGSLRVSMVFIPPMVPRKIEAPIPWGHTSWRKDGTG